MKKVKGEITYVLEKAKDSKIKKALEKCEKFIKEALEMEGWAHPIMTSTFFIPTLHIIAHILRILEKFRQCPHFFLPDKQYIHSVPSLLVNIVKYCDGKP